MFIRTETGAIINSDHVIRIETVRKHLEWKIQDANIYEIYAYITSMDTESRVLIGTYQNFEKAQEIMDKIYLCLDANRSLDFYPKKVNTEHEPLHASERIKIPDRATNGDVLKAVFGCGEVLFKQAEDVNMICAYGLDETPSSNGTFFTEAWWNEPFTREWAKEGE